ncbi:MAG: hypothetical protein EBT57_03440 [Verrucomicrobia bacterium]|nr:hypothetical protein [Verrucomicrobiota bacterium]
MRCLRHSRIAGRERGDRHLEIALEFFGQVIIKLCSATPATAQASWGGRRRCPRGLVAEVFGGLGQVGEETTRDRRRVGNRDNDRCASRSTKLSGNRFFSQRGLKVDGSSDQMGLREV